MREAVTIHFSYTGLCDSVQLTNFTLCCIACGFIRCSILLNSFFLIQFNVWHFPQYQYSQPNEVQKCSVCVCLPIQFSCSGFGSGLQTVLGRGLTAPTSSQSTDVPIAEEAGPSINHPVSLSP